MYNTEIKKGPFDQLALKVETHNVGRCLWDK